MANGSKDDAPLTEREVFYFRTSYRNRVYQSVMAYFAACAERDGLTKARIAALLQRDPASITRWLSGPGNWTLDTVSDLLLAMNAEMSNEVIPFADQSTTTVHSATSNIQTGSFGPAAVTSTDTRRLRAVR